MGEWLNRWIGEQTVCFMHGWRKKEEVMIE